MFAGVALLIFSIAAESLALLLSPATAVEVTLDEARYVCLLGREAVEASGSRGRTAAATIARRRIRGVAGLLRRVPCHTYKRVLHVQAGLLEALIEAHGTPLCGRLPCGCGYVLML